LLNPRMAGANTKVGAGQGVVLGLISSILRAGVTGRTCSRPQRIKKSGRGLKVPTRYTYGMI
jgi:hypothetical protein